MDQFIQQLPYDYLGKKTITIENNRLAITSKNLLQSISDEYPFEKIDPVFKTISRGEKEWGNVVYGLIVATIGFFLLIKIFHNGLFSIIAYVIQLCLIATACYLLSLGYFKRNFIYVLDTAGDCIIALKESPKSTEFLKKLKARLEKSKTV
jgi:hypothetical protein